MPSNAPAPRPRGVSDVEAAELCREWMIYLGELDTVIAGPEARGTCDLYSSRWLAWVVNQRGNVSLGVVSKAADVSSSDGRRGLIFFGSGCSPDARDLATQRGIPLLHFVAEDGVLSGLNQLAKNVVWNGSLLTG